MNTKSIPKKSLGQNFLRDPKILQKIADAADISKEDLVVEIGPGEGTLTKHLLEKARNVIVIEKDNEMIPVLEEKFGKEIEGDKLKIINGDILEYEIKEKKYKLVGNIPYYITGLIFRKFLESKNSPDSMTFVIQKEVADRIIANNGKESLLSIAIKAYGTPKYKGIIKSGSFFPRPKVDSAIIHIENISKQKLEGIEENYFFNILHRGFAHKRKLLIKNIFDANSKINHQNLKDLFEKLKIDERVRAEDLSVENWINIAKNLLYLESEHKT